MKRPGLVFVIAATVLIFLAAVLAPRRGGTATPPPSEAQLSAFIRELPASARPAIAARLRKEAALRPRPVLMAVGVEGGRAVTIVHRRRSAAGHVLSAELSSYSAPAVPSGHLIETAVRADASEPRDVQFVVTGTNGRTREIDLREWEPLATDGPSSLIERGEIVNSGGNVLHAPGSSGDGRQLFVTGGPPLRRLALAPAELPPETIAEPGGYALLFDTATLWRAPRPIGTSKGSSISGLWTYLPTSWGLGRVAFYGEEFEYRVSALAHVYARAHGAWRYARSFSVEGSGLAWTTNNEPALARAIGGTADFGVPDRMKIVRCVALR